MAHPQKISLSLLLTGLLLLGCTKQEKPEASFSDTPILEKLTRLKPDEEKFRLDVQKFYRALAAGDWAYTYEGRTQSFKKVVPREMYLASVADAGGKLSSLTYEVLAHDEFIANGVHEKRLIIKFVRKSAKPEYSVVWWKFEDGQWRCEEVGLRAIPLFGRFGEQEK